MQIQDGWNMVSVPGLHPVNQNVNTWWPDRNLVADVYKWTTTYEPVTFTNPGDGYWMLHSGNQTYNTGDEWPAVGIQIVAHEPIPLRAGWNLIGGYDNRPLVSSLATTPPGLIVPNTTYGWNGTFYNATNIIPGFGYYIMSTGNGIINLPAIADGPIKPVVHDDKSQWGKITIADASGKSYTLYSVNGEVNLEQYQMPPSPPEGMFDVRYSSNRKAEALKEGSQTIKMQGLTYPVTIRVEKMGIKLEDETGELLSVRIKSGEEVEIRNDAINKLIISDDIVPEAYSLEQNYPNPFNPSTKIRYSIPIIIYSETNQSTQITLKVYDVLGNEVATLVNEEKSAGSYEVKFDTAGLSSGIYFYKMQAGDYVEIKKMVLVK
jgi:hypothetical protein